MASNDEKLLRILEEVLLIDDDQYKDDYGPDEIETWDSLATVNIAAAVEKEFGYAMEPEQMAELECIGDIKEALKPSGVTFDA
ncbi:MAG: acyl carrier protein [candidate division Zixibacteria bacterium]|nr:acyl carrier protein [candidate division Zixibacteria bacterium]